MNAKGQNNAVGEYYERGFFQFALMAFVEGGFFVQSLLQVVVSYLLIGKDGGYFGGVGRQVRWL